METVRAVRSWACNFSCTEKRSHAEVGHDRRKRERNNRAPQIFRIAGGAAQVDDRRTRPGGRQQQENEPDQLVPQRSQRLDYLRNYMRNKAEDQASHRAILILTTA